jgi:hypothetical protein
VSTPGSTTHATPTSHHSAPPVDWAFNDDATPGSLEASSNACSSSQYKVSSPLLRGRGSSASRPEASSFTRGGHPGLRSPQVLSQGGGGSKWHSLNVLGGQTPLLAKDPSLTSVDSETTTTPQSNVLLGRSGTLVSRANGTCKNRKQLVTYGYRCHLR